MQINLDYAYKSYLHRKLVSKLMSMVATQPFLFFFPVEHCAQHKAMDRIHFIVFNQAAGQTKFDCWPYLAREPDFGYAWSREFLVLSFFLRAKY